MKKSLISSHLAHHRPRDKLVTYYMYCYQRDIFEKYHEQLKNKARSHAKKRAESER
mgnify:CR=1 FL=1